MQFLKQRSTNLWCSGFTVALLTMRKYLLDSTAIKEKLFSQRCLPGVRVGDNGEISSPVYLEGRRGPLTSLPCRSGRKSIKLRYLNGRVATIRREEKSHQSMTTHPNGSLEGCGHTKESAQGGEATPLAQNHVAQCSLHV